ncbi:MAG: hypothetical protein B7Y05_16140 [Polynucleobacter sp. 24-46-87]|jgi:hypothetical protein|uniref:hypothetical protein n=1 Tax=Polynucleobacter sp. 35-46-11 TaxID=1970425 RepID=UPI000BD7779A|nr:hypothetical protein [Polynucleobacter sp. 35-46-11]OYY16065.1 MAG: hypothetical protein B7Y67_09500 [Polynucleobacter sp. 35-46-11]OZA10836.1 MAG: hypothetical protein B7Y05_16140 [Polynucleobacter sp. 24-46-87]
MSKWLRKLPGYQTYEPGLERKVLLQLPQFTVMGVLAISLPSLLARLLLSSKAERIIDILVISTEIFFLSMVLTLAIAALIIMLSKGPAYVADAYPLIESDRPAE